MCLKRLAQYKPLTGALLYQVEETEAEISVEILSADPELELPEILIGIEFAFLVGADPQGDKGAGYAAVRNGKAADEEPRSGGFYRQTRHHRQ